MRKTLIAAAMTTVLGVTPLPLKTSAAVSAISYSTQKCGVPPGGKGNVCVTVQWEESYINGSWMVQPVKVKYGNSSKNGTAKFDPNYFYSFTVNRGNCVRPYVGLVRYGLYTVGPGGTRIFPVPNKHLFQDFRCPTFSTSVSIGGGSILKLETSSIPPLT